MALKNSPLPPEPDLLYEASVENRVHCFIAWDDLVLPLEAYFKRTGFRAVVGSNNPVAYEPNVYALGPDLWVVNGGEDRGQEGWVPWKEGGLMPTLILEMLSPTTEHRDRGEKRRVYQDVFKTIDYFLFESTTGGIEYYRLKNGVYVRRHADRHGRFPCASLPLSLGLVHDRLRWFEKDGRMLPTLQEVTDLATEEHLRADLERERANTEHERANTEHERADRANAERERANAALERADAELQQLREELKRLRGS